MSVIGFNSTGSKIISVPGPRGLKGDDGDPGPAGPEGPAGPPGDGGNVLDDTSPQLGGDLDLNSHTVGAATAADLTKLHAITKSAAEINGVANGATANSSDATLLARANHTGTQSADTITDGSTNHVFTAADDTKLGGIATGATANDTDANLRARSSHTGTQTSSTISDFTEAVQDAVAALLAQGTNVTLTYDDTGNTLTVASSGSGGLDAEAARDAIGVALVGTGVVSVTVNDGADTITISSTATANDTDANLKSRANHTGTQAASTISDFASAVDAELPVGTHAATSKTTPVDADEMPLVDSGASNGLKKLTWANLKATLKTYFDSVTTTLTNKTVDLGSNTVTATLAQLNTAVSDADVASRAGAETLTNKRVTLRVQTSSAPGATPTIDVDSYDQINLTAIGAAITSMSSGITGTPTAGQKGILRLKDDGTARAITWGSSWRAIGVTLPTTTVVSKTLYVGWIYNATDSKYDVVAVAQEA
jgi:hypothetical protein